MPVSIPSILREARRLHGLGYAVVPCAGKKAVMPGWNEERLALTELDAALQGTNYNIAIALNLSDLIDVECDTDEAESNLQAMFGGQVPPTPTWRSKRGLHRLFRRPSGLPEKAVVKLDGIEFRIGNDKGALSIVPPSVHPDGPRYEWLAGLSIHQVAPAELPPAIASRLEQAPKFANGANSANATPEGEGIKEGDRNSSLFKIACKLARSGLTPASVEVALQSENLAQCRPPLESPKSRRLQNRHVRNARKVRKQTPGFFWKSPSPIQNCGTRRTRPMPRSGATDTASTGRFGRKGSDNGSQSGSMTPKKTPSARRRCKTFSASLRARQRLKAQPTRDAFAWRGMTDESTLTWPTMLVCCPG